MATKKLFENLFDREHSSLTTVYIVALSSIAIIAFAFQALKFNTYSDQLRSIDVIRLVEQQKNLVERDLAALLNTLALEVDKRQGQVTRLTKIYNLLSNKDEKIQEKIDTDICHLPACVEAFNQDFASMLDPTDLSEKNLNFQIDKINSYNEQLEIVTDRLDISVNETSKKIIFLDMLFLALLLTVLLVQAIWGFRPAVQRLNEALSVRADFISRISHEIRNPMNSIMGMADILRSTQLTTEQKQYVNNLQRSSHVLLDMLHNLVDFSGLENRAISLKEAKFDIYKLIDKVTDVISIQAHEKNLELMVDIDPAIPHQIYGDEIRIEQVLLNLMNNALKFTNSGSITLRMACTSTEIESETIDVRFEIADTGIGIEKDQISKVFNSFVQEDSSIKRRFGGSGLGLAISKEIIHLMGSTIEVESQKNQGSTFSFKTKFRYDSRSKLDSQFLDEKIIFMTGSKDLTNQITYLNKIATESAVVKSVKELKEELFSSPQNTKVIVDDSLGIINIINAANVISNEMHSENVFALMRSNFSKENMELIRNNGFRNFLIKPFRAWHIMDTKGRYRHPSQDSAEADRYHSLRGEIKGKKLSILAVDDSNDNLFLLKEILAPLTDKIDFANNGLEACEQIEKKRYDVVFMDIQMPVMDGYSAITRIRHKYKNIPIFAVTAHAGIVDEKKCLDAGFTGRITKPISRKKIYTTLQKVFGISMAQKKKDPMTAEEKMLQKLMPQYFDARLKDIDILRGAINNQDFDVMQKVGHRIKGSAKSYGFEEVGDMSARLEKAANERSLNDCEKIVMRIEEKIGYAKRSFQSEHS